MPDFTALPVQSGVGDYHFNRFRVAFNKPPGLSTAALAADFVTNFPLYLNSQFATVVWGTRTFNSKPTLRFHGFVKKLGIDLARPHTDWVVREWCDLNVGFTAQTLKREFLETSEDAAAAVGGGAGGRMLPVLGPIVGPVVGAGAAVHYNRMHFLAGRRSWRVDEGKAFGAAGDVFILETIAVERFSAEFYRIADSVAGMEEKIPDIWIANLNNFINKRALVRVSPPLHLKARWTKKYDVDYFRTSFKDLNALKAHPEFVDAYRLFPTILP